MSHRSRSRQSIAALALVGGTLVPAACGDADAAADPDRFCAVNRDLEQLDDLTTIGPDAARDLVAATRGLLIEAERTAPDEIRAEVRTTTEAYEEILDFYADAEFDVDPDAFGEALASGEIGNDPPEAAAVFSWIDENCAAP